MLNIDDKKKCFLISQTFILFPAPSGLRLLSYMQVVWVSWQNVSDSSGGSAQTSTSGGTAGATGQISAGQSVSLQRRRPSLQRQQKQTWVPFIFCSAHLQRGGV